MVENRLERETMNAGIDLRTVNQEELERINLDEVNMNLDPPEFEPHRQYYFMAKCRKYVQEKAKELGRPLTCATVTFGCPIVSITQKC